MNVRSLAALPLLLGLAACAAGPRQPGAPFAGSSLLAPLSDQEEAHDDLLRADLSRADSVARLGHADGRAGGFTDDVIWLRGGLPMLRGRAAARAVVAAESLASPAAIRWQPVRAAVSSDGRSGFSYGYTIYGLPSSASTPSLRVDRYIAFWRREPAGWRIAAYAETYGAPPPSMSLPASAESAALADTPMTRARGALEDVRSADVDFSRDAGRYGTGTAFGRYAADDAQIFSGPGEFISGPEAIRQSFGSSSSAGELTWHPVAGEVAKSGDLGFTVGNAVFTGKRADGAPQVRYSKYLTVWKKQHDGSWKYVVDGGSARPDN